MILFGRIIGIIGLGCLLEFEGFVIGFEFESFVLDFGYVTVPYTFIISYVLR